MTARQPITSQQIAELQKLLDTTVITPADKEAYAKSITRWSRAAEKPAGACITPKTNEEVAIALKYASEHDLEIAVRGGGHSTAGASSTDGGLLIDLKEHMRTTAVDAKNKTIKVGGGGTWGDVDAALAPHGLAAVGGTVSDTGVGGLTLGGGFGWLGIKHGLVCDNLLSCTVVLASGKIVTASSTQNEDLFWALRGAGQNFGVVTEFVFRAHEQGEMWAGLMLFPATPENIAKAVEVSNKLYMLGPDGKCIANRKAAGGLGFARPPPAHQPLMMASLVFDGPEEEGKKMFKELLDIGPVMSTMAMVPYVKANKLMDVPIGMRVSLKGAAYELPLRSEFPTSVLESFIKFTNENPDALGSFVVWELFPSSAILAVDNKDTAFANRGDHMNACIMPMWTNAKNDQVCRQWSRDVAQMFKKELESRGAETGESTDGFIGKRGAHGATMVYGNYDQYEEKSKDVFGANYERLQDLKAKYDPENRFNKLFAISPTSGTP